MGQVFVTPTPIMAGGLYVDVGLASGGNIAVFAALLVLLVPIVASELFSFHVPYSKFAQEDAIKELPLESIQKLFHAKMSARSGFFVLYFLPLISYLIMWICFAAQNMKVIGVVAPSPTYSILLLVGWLMSFTKRCLEVLFVHIYSGTIPVMSTIAIALGYSAAGLAALFFSNQVVGYDAFGPQTVVKDSICVVAYLIGFSVNALAHYQLRLVRLRGTDSAHPEKKYFGPSDIGILFKIFICPHYVFEILIFASLAVFGATSVHYIVGFTVLLYLGMRTRATYKWYVKKGLIGSSRNSQNQDKQSLLAFSSSQTANPQYRA